jgi:hypothetical protein
VLDYGFKNMPKNNFSAVPLNENSAASSLI